MLRLRTETGSQSVEPLRHPCTNVLPRVEGFKGSKLPGVNNAACLPLFVSTHRAVRRSPDFAPGSSPQRSSWTQPFSVHFCQCQPHAHAAFRWASASGHPACRSARLGRSSGGPQQSPGTQHIAAPTHGFRWVLHREARRRHRDCWDIVPNRLENASHECAGRLHDDWLGITTTEPPAPEWAIRHLVQHGLQARAPISCRQPLQGRHIVRCCSRAGFPVCHIGAQLALPSAPAHANFFPGFLSTPQ